MDYREPIEGLCFLSGHVSEDVCDDDGKDALEKAADAIEALLSQLEAARRQVREKGYNVNDRALNINIPSALYDKLKAEAERKHISLAAMVRVICSEYFEERSWRKNGDF